MGSPLLPFWKGGGGGQLLNLDLSSLTDDDVGLHVHRQAWHWAWHFYTPCVVVCVISHQYYPVEFPDFPSSCFHNIIDVTKCICTLSLCYCTLYVNVSVSVTSFLFFCVSFSLLHANLTSQKDVESMRKSERWHQLPLVHTVRKKIIKLRNLQLVACLL